MDMNDISEIGIGWVFFFFWKKGRICYNLILKWLVIIYDNGIVFRGYLMSLWCMWYGFIFIIGF